MARAKKRVRKPPKEPNPVQFFTQKRGNTFVANLMVTMMVPGYGATEKAAMTDATEFLLEGLRRLVREAKKHPERR